MKIKCRVGRAEPAQVRILYTTSFYFIMRAWWNWLTRYPYTIEISGSIPDARNDPNIIKFQNLIIHLQHL